LSSSLILFLVLFEVNFSSAVQRLEVESIIMLKSRLSLTHFIHRLKRQTDLVHLCGHILGFYRPTKQLK